MPSDNRCSCGVLVLGPLVLTSSENGAGSDQHQSGFERPATGTCPEVGRKAGAELLTTETTAHRAATRDCGGGAPRGPDRNVPSVGTPTSECESAEIKTTNIIGRWPIELVCIANYRSLSTNSLN